MGRVLAAIRQPQAEREVTDYRSESDARKGRLAPVYLDDVTRPEVGRKGKVSSSAAPTRQRTAGNGGMRRAWDALEAEAARFEAQLASEGLGVIDVGPQDNSPSRAKGRKDIVSLTPAIENSVTGSVWDLGAAVDALTEALVSCRFQDLLDGQICEMLSRKIPWHRIARTLRCSKRRVSLVSRTVDAWRQQVGARERTASELDERISGAQQLERMKQRGAR